MPGETGANSSGDEETAGGTSPAGGGVSGVMDAGPAMSSSQPHGRDRDHVQGGSGGALQLVELLEPMLAGDQPHRAAARAHHQRLRRGAMGPEVHALHQLAVGDAAGDE